MAARAIGPRFCVEKTSLLASRSAKLWQRRERDQALHVRGRLRNRGRGVLWRALAAAARFGRPWFRVENSLLLASRGAKPWRGHTLEGSGGSGTRFWTSAALRGKFVTFCLEGARNRGALAVAAHALGRRRFCVESRHFWPRGARNRGKGVLWR